MKYSTQDRQLPLSSYTASQITGRRSVAETLLETLSETLTQGSLSPGLSKQAVRRSRRRQLAGVLAMIAGLGALAMAFSRPPSGISAVGGEPIAALEIVRGRVEMSASGRRDASMLMLAGGESIHVGAVVEAGAVSVDAVKDAPSAGRAAVRLAGGQSVRLDRGTRVRFSSSTSVTLDRGAVYVDSAGGGNIEVRTALGIVRDIGTQFEVRLLPETDAAGPSLRIRVREGSVELAQGDQTHLVVAGEGLVTHEDGRLRRKSSRICGPHWDWAVEIAPAPEVTGLSLKDFLDQASEEACWTVRYVDQATAEIAAETILHGNVTALPLNEAASMILTGSALDYRLEDGKLIVGPPKDRG